MQVELTEVIFCLAAAAGLSVCGICALNTGIRRREKHPASNALTVFLILCGIIEAVSPFIWNVLITRDPAEGNGYLLLAVSYAAVIFLYTAIYRLSYKKDTDNIIKLTFGFSVIIAVIHVISAFMMLVAAGIESLLILPKY